MKMLFLLELTRKKISKKEKKWIYGYPNKKI
jgi:hypothetical protein